MLRTLLAQIKEFKKDSLLTPGYMILEVLMETVIPLLMASIIDYGVDKGISHISTGLEHGWWQQRQWGCSPG